MGFVFKIFENEGAFREKLLNVGSFAEARAKGKLRTEGKGYIVQDGDVIEFLI